MTIDIELGNVFAENGISDRDYKRRLADGFCAYCKSKVGPHDDYDEDSHLCARCKTELEYTLMSFLRMFNRYELEYLDSVVEGATLMDVARRPVEDGK